MGVLVRLLVAKVGLRRVSGRTDRQGKSDRMSETIEIGDGAERVRPWTVKGIAPEERNAAIAAADREGVTIGEWLSRAIRTQVQADRRSDRSPVVLEEAVRREADQGTDLADLERMIALAKQIAEVNKTTIPTGITRATHGLLRKRLKALQGGQIVDRG